MNAIKHLRTFVLYCIILIFIPMEFSHANMKLPDSTFKWTFVPKGTSVKIPISIRTSIGHQLPKDVPCCSGSNVGVLQGKSLVDILGGTKNVRRFSMFTPPIFGLRSIYLGTRQVLETNADYYGAGPIIEFTPEEASDPYLQLTVTYEVPGGYIPSFWLKPFIIGEYDDLIGVRARSLVYQRYVPLFQVAVFLLIAFALMWNRLVTRYSDIRFNYFLQALFAWAAFFLSLSGLPRFYWPIAGDYLHFIIRGLAGLASARLVFIMMNSSKSTIKKATVVCLGAIALGAVLSLDGDQRFQMIGYVATFATFLIALFHLVLWLSNRTVKEPIHILILITAIIFAIGNFADATKLMGGYLNYTTPLPFLNRVTDSPLILTSIFYLAQEASKRIQSEYKSEAIKQLSDQVLHDLRSPVSTIRQLVAMEKEYKTLSDERLNLLESACARITDMCDSLKEERRLQQNKDPQCHNLVILLREIFLEKSLEYGSNAISLHCYEEAPYLSVVDAFEFKRVISNIINNAYEARKADFHIDVLLSQNKKINTLEIRDNGIGIESSRLEELGKKGTTFGKEGGLGLGLFSSQKNIETWNGSLTIESATGQGARVIIKLPRSFLHIS